MGVSFSVVFKRAVSPYGTLGSDHVALAKGYEKLDKVAAKFKLPTLGPFVSADPEEMRAMAEDFGLLDGQLEHAFGGRCQPDFARARLTWGWAMLGRDWPQPPQGNPGRLQLDAEVAQHAAGHAARFGEESEQELLGADVVETVTFAFVSSALQGVSGAGTEGVETMQVCVHVSRLQQA